MAKPTSSKETMLTNVRNALLHKTKQPFPNTESVDNIYAIEHEPLEILFAKEFLKVSGEFIFCETEKECTDTLKQLITQNEWEQITVLEPKLHDLFDRHQFIAYNKKMDTAQADVGITMCEALIARTGSILISSKEASGRVLPIYPTINIVIASTRQLVMDIQDGFALVRKKYDGNLPSMVNLNTGPSRTADIEKTLVLGAHGPREVFVFLIDDWTITDIDGSAH
jgi:L-lactate dehydrogenase complex protein LldG